MDKINLRPVVKWFAEQMELRLQENDHKNGWLHNNSWELFDRLQEESEELQAEIRNYEAKYDEDVIQEAADVANFAMMIADLRGNKIGESQFQPPPDTEIEKWIEDKAHIIGLPKVVGAPEGGDPDLNYQMRYNAAKTMGDAIYSLLHSQHQKELDSLQQILQEEFCVNTQNYPKEYYVLFQEKFKRAIANWQQLKSQSK